MHSSWPRTASQHMALQKTWSLQQTWKHSLELPSRSREPTGRWDEGNRQLMLLPWGSHRNKIAYISCKIKTRTTITLKNPEVTRRKHCIWEWKRFTYRRSFTSSRELVLHFDVRYVVVSHPANSWEIPSLSFEVCWLLHDRRVHLQMRVHAEAHRRKGHRKMFVW